MPPRSERISEENLRTELLDGRFLEITSLGFILLVSCMPCNMSLKHLSWFCGLIGPFHLDPHRVGTSYPLAAHGLKRWPPCFALSLDFVCRVLGLVVAPHQSNIGSGAVFGPRALRPSLQDLWLCSTSLTPT